MTLNFLRSSQSLQIISFSLAILIYGMFGSPTPDDFRFTEILILLLLGIAVRVSYVQRFHFLFLGYGVSVPMIVGIIAGCSLNDIIRDIIPFLFLFLPLYFGWIGNSRPILVLSIVTCVGFIFSIRTIISYQSILFTPSLWGQGAPVDLLYLANSPEVLWAALISIGYGAFLMINKNKMIKGLGIIALSFIPLVAMALMTQRAGIGAVCVYSIILSASLIYLRPKIGLIFLCGMVGFGFFLWPVIEILFQILWQKTELVGLNSRAQEWQAVFNILSQNWMALLFGIGWGGHLENPAVGGISVNYTHSLISSLLLKTGVVGSIIILFGCFTPVAKAVCESMKGVSMREYIILGAVIFPFIISVFLYASYKSLGFGLILLVFALFLHRKLEKNDEVVS
jgi:hypothetical protein